MPELPDVSVYVERLEALVAGQVLSGVRVRSPFLLRTVTPPLSEAHGRVVGEVRRLGKRVVLRLDGDGEPLFLVIHLMIAGRLRWRGPKASVTGRDTVAALDFASSGGAPLGVLLFTEASKKKRASLHLVRGESALAEFDRGGLEVMGASRDAFADALTRERHTLKRTLTDPRLFSGIGNAYSDEILHRARLSPVAMSTSLDAQAIDRLFAATVAVLTEWTDRLRAEVGGGFPEKVTAFREGMTVHGRYRQPCPDCGSPVQRIVHAENETNYCATCQTGGRLLADRALSRLLKSDWPRTLEELEERRKP